MIDLDIPETVATPFVVATSRPPRDPASVARARLRHPLAFDLLNTPLIQIRTLPAGESGYAALMETAAWARTEDRYLFHKLTHHIVVMGHIPPVSQPDHGQATRAVARVIAEACDGVVYDAWSHQVLPHDFRFGIEHPEFCLADEWLATFISDAAQPGGPHDPDHTGRLDPDEDPTADGQYAEPRRPHDDHQFPDPGHLRRRHQRDMEAPPAGGLHHHRPRPDEDPAVNGRPRTRTDSPGENEAPAVGGRRRPPKGAAEDLAVGDRHRTASAREDGEPAFADWHQPRGDSMRTDEASNSRGLHLMTAGLHRFALPELEAHRVPVGNVFAAITLLRCLAVTLLSEHWDWLACNPGVRARRLASHTWVAGRDVWRYWAADPRDADGGRVRVRLRRAEETDPPTLPYLSVGPPTDFAAPIAEWWNDVVDLAMPFVPQSNRRMAA